MSKRFLRAAWVVVVAAVIAQGCFLSKSRRGTGTNIGTGLGSDEPQHPPGTPAGQPDR